VNCAYCDETVVDDDFAECALCKKPVHMAGTAFRYCAEQTGNGDVCRTCVARGCHICKKPLLDGPRALDDVMLGSFDDAPGLKAPCHESCWECLEAKTR